MDAQVNVYKMLHRRLKDRLDTQIGDIPKWFRELSQFQINAANGLSNAIRDDMEQRSTHRVIRLLDRIGLYPKLEGHEVKPLMELSRGNELAFLWFLMERYYKTPTEECNSNEQLIMSSIFKLDLLPTLRRLDRILPLGNPPQETVQKDKGRKKKRRPKNPPEKVHETLNFNKPPKYPSPYFQPVIMPRPYKRPITSYYPVRPALDVDIPPEFGSGPSPMWSRWFGRYQLKEDQRIVRSILNEQINKIFYEFTTTSLKVNQVKSLCKHHQDISQIENSLAEKLKTIARDKLIDHIDADVKAREERRKRIVAQLERAADCIQARFREMALNLRISSMRKNLFERNTDRGSEQYSSKKPDFICFGEKQKSRNRNGQRSEGGKDTGAGDTNQILGSLVLCKESAKCGQKGAGDASSADESVEKVEMFECGDGVRAKISNDYICERECNRSGFIRVDDDEQAFSQIRSRKSKRCKRCSITPKIDLNCLGRSDSNCELKRDCDCMESKSKAYFDIGSIERPASFNYRKTFSSKSHETYQTEIKRAFIKAIIEDIEVLDKFTCEYDDAVDLLKPVLDAAISHNVLTTFKEQTDLFKKIYENYEKRAKANSERLNFGYDTYDPNDKTLMMTMLRKGLERIAEDHRYVLPTLPDVWKVPMLMEWICNRYGKLYSQKERIQLCKDTQPLMKALSAILREWVLPTPDCQEKIYKMVPYNQRNQLLSRAKLIREKYVRQFSETIMEIGRKLYFAMRLQLCSRSQKEIFYAYMPARYIDVNFSVRQEFETFKIKSLLRKSNQSDKHNF